MNNINNSDFQRLADRSLTYISDLLEKADEAGDLDVDYQAGILTIILPDGKQFIVNRHAPTRQLWLSSPISGGLHFSFDGSINQWKLADGRILNQILSEELRALAHIEVKL